MSSKQLFANNPIILVDDDFIGEVERMMDAHLDDDEVPYVIDAARCRVAAGDIARTLLRARGMPSI